MSIPEQSMPSTVYTELAAWGEVAVIAGFREVTGSNVYELID